MTHIETARVNEVIGVQIGIIQELAHKLTPESDLEGIENDIATLEKAITYLKGIIEALPHRHQ